MRAPLLAIFISSASICDLQPAFADQLMPGKEILQRECSACHSIGKVGNSPNPKSPPFREVVKKYPPEHLTEALGEGIGIAHSDMPEFIFEPEDIMEIIDYLNSLK